MHTFGPSTHIGYVPKRSRIGDVVIDNLMGRSFVRTMKGSRRVWVEMGVGADGVPVDPKTMILRPLRSASASFLGRIFAETEKRFNREMSALRKRNVNRKKR